MISKRFVSVCSAGLLLASCNSAAGLPPDLFQAGQIHKTQLSQPGSFQMDRVKDLLYISSYTNSTVKTYGWPNAKHDQTLRGFVNQNGLCVDSEGDVFVANTNANNILEYAHGGTKPIAQLSDLPKYYPGSCAVNPVTGDLAVTNLGYGSYGSETANLVIYHRAKGEPKPYTISSIYYYYMCGYDDQGNLVADGSSRGGVVAFAILPRDGKSLQPLTLDETFKFPGGIQWDGKHWAIGDQQATIYQFDIKGTKGTMVGATTLNETDAIYEFFISGKRIIAPEYGTDKAQVFAYPAGGSAITTILGLHQPFGAVISHGE